MNQIDFLPRHYRQGEARRHRIVREVLLLAVAGGCIAVWYVNASHRMANLERYAAAARDRASATQSQATEMIRLKMQKASTLRRTHVQRELMQALDMSPAVATLAQLMPASIAATSLTVTATRPTPAARAAAPATADPGAARPTPLVQAPPAPMRIELTGMAPSDMAVADFVGRVSSHPLFANVKMDYSRAAQSGELIGREFRIEMDVPLDREYRPAHAVQQGVANAG